MAALFDFPISDPRKSVAHHDSQEDNTGEKTSDVCKPGDTAAAKKEYERFLALWKDADPDIPILQEAQAEYAQLR